MLGAKGDFLSYNLFAYCRNNPVNHHDMQGTWDWGVFIGVVAAVVAVGVTVATLGAAAPAAACAVSTAISVSTGLSATAATVVADIAVVASFTATTTYVADIAYASVTGESPLLNEVFDGDTEAYSIGASLAFGTTGYMLDIGAMAPACFIEGTLVCTETGEVAIEQIQQGDYVWAWNESTGDVALKQVVETYINETSELTHIFAAGEEIVCTPSHPFYAPQKGWTAACKLRAGDILVLVNGEYVVVEKVQHELLESPIKVYNFQVEDYHTYYVGGFGALVHNSCESRPKSPDKVTDAYIDNNDIDAHSFKHQAARIPKSQISRYDSCPH